MNSPAPAADEPLLIISGLPSPEPQPAWVQAWSAASVAQWVAPQSLLGPRSTAMASRQAHIVWLYRAPWSSVGSGSLRLGSWLSLQRQALRQRGQNAGVWTLVNADEVDPDALAESLGLWVDTPSGLVGKEYETAAEATGRKLLWAKLFDWAAPQAWEVYEALEAAAWSGPQQAPPLLRDELQAPDLGALEALQHRLSDAEEQSKLAQQWQERAQELQAAQDAALEEVAQQAQQAEAAAAALQAELKQAREEGELLLMQLHQVQEELEQAFLQRNATEAAAAQAAEAAQAAHAELTSQLENARAERDQRAVEFGHASASLQQAQAAIQQLQDAAQQSQAAQAETAEQLAQAQTVAAQRESQLKEAQEEGELLLLQLHQVQEELEQLFLQGKEREAAATRAAEEAQAAQAELSRQLEGTRAERDQRTAERDQRTAERDQRSAELDRRTAERDQANSSLQQAQSAVQQLQASLQQSQAAMEQTRQELHARTSERDQRTAERDQANSSLQQAQAAVQQLQASLQQSQAAMEQSKAALEQSKAAQAETSQQLAEAQNVAAQRENQLKESQEEGELLLLQLHQVQEELETHFLKGKDLEQQLQSVGGRYARLQRRFPDVVEVDSIEMKEVSASSSSSSFLCALKGLAISSNYFDELHLRLTQDRDIHGVQLYKPNGDFLIGTHDIPLSTETLRTGSTEQLSIFRSASSTAWGTLRIALKAMVQALAYPELNFRLSSSADISQLKHAVDHINKELFRLPAIFRFDAVEIQSHRDHGSYQFLWLKFLNSSYGALNIECFEFRISTVQTLDKNITVIHPRIEFPKINGQSPFEGWFEESSGEFGPKLELRTDLVERAFDLGVWHKLPKGTQSLLGSVFATIPQIIDKARTKSSASISWANWENVALRMIEVIRAQLTVYNETLRKRVVAALPRQESITSASPTEEQPKLSSVDDSNQSPSNNQSTLEVKTATDLQLNKPRTTEKASKRSRAATKK